MATRALLVGINKSQVPGADLRGCVNDVKDLSEALIKFLPRFQEKRHPGAARHRRDAESDAERHYGSLARGEKRRRPCAPLQKH